MQLAQLATKVLLGEQRTKERKEDCKKEVWDEEEKKQH